TTPLTIPTFTTATRVTTAVGGAAALPTLANKIEEALPLIEEAEAALAEGVSQEEILWETLGEPLTEAAKRSQTFYDKWRSIPDFMLNMATKADIRLVDRIAKEFGLSEGQRELMHHEY